MTTSVKIKSHNYPVLVQTWERRWDSETQKLGDEFVLRDARVQWPEHGEISHYVTTTQKLTAQDLEYDDPRALASKPEALPGLA
jgi:hypothetical protein